MFAGASTAFVEKAFPCAAQHGELPEQTVAGEPTVNLIFSCPASGMGASDVSAYDRICGRAPRLRFERAPISKMPPSSARVMPFLHLSIYNRG